MKKILFLLTSILAVSSALCLTGCNDKGNTGNTTKDDLQTKTVTENDDNEDTCPDCEERGMPKVRFKFKDGRPTGKDGVNDGVEPPHSRHHKKHPHPHKNPRPAPPEDDGQDKNEN